MNVNNITNTDVEFDYPDVIYLTWYSFVIIIYGFMRSSALFVDIIIIIIITHLLSSCKFTCTQYNYLYFLVVAIVDKV